MFIKKFTALLLATAMIFSFSACHSGKPKNAGKTIHYHLDAEPMTLDPQIASDTSSLTVVRALFEGLTRLDANEAPQPGVAKSWESNADKTQFTFHLRPDASWGKKRGPVTAADFVFAFQRALDPKTGSATCMPMYCIKNAKQIHTGTMPASSLGVTAKDAQTLVVDLAYPSPDFPQVAASAVFMPCNQKFFNEAAGHYGLDTEYVLGNGPFCIDGDYGWTHGQSLNLADASAYKGKNQPLPSAISFSIGGKKSDFSSPADALSKLSTRCHSDSDVAGRHRPFFWLHNCFRAGYHMGAWLQHAVSVLQKPEAAAGVRAGLQPFRRAFASSGGYHGGGKYYSAEDDA